MAKLYINTWRLFLPTHYFHLDCELCSKSAFSNIHFVYFEIYTQEGEKGRNAIPRMGASLWTTRGHLQRDQWLYTPNLQRSFDLSFVYTPVEMPKIATYGDFHRFIDE